jgi:hypothetical protein
MPIVPVGSWQKLGKPHAGRCNVARTGPGRVQDGYPYGLTSCNRLHRTQTPQARVCG